MLKGCTKGGGSSNNLAASSSAGIEVAPTKCSRRSKSVFGRRSSTTLPCAAFRRLTNFTNSVDEGLTARRRTSSVPSPAPSPTLIPLAGGMTAGVDVAGGVAGTGSGTRRSRVSEAATTSPCGVGTRRPQDVCEERHHRPSRYHVGMGPEEYRRCTTRLLGRT